MYLRPFLIIIFLILQSFLSVSKADTRNSNNEQILLAKHLSSIGAIFYGAEWCPYSQLQKEEFGKEALKYLNYVDCGSPQEGPKNCPSVAGIPVWVLNNETYESALTLDELIQVSNYKKN